jgi:membrane-associated protease RseP (regulator of RpoE activity)
MRDETMGRSWRIAALASVAGAGVLAFGLFLAVGKDTLADSDVKIYAPDGVDAIKVYQSDEGEDGVRVVRVVSGNGGDAETSYEEAFGEEGGKQRGYLGIDSREYTKTDEGGAYIQMVVEDSPADKAGLKKGDVIVGFGGTVIRGPGKLTEKIRATKPGDSVKIEVRRDGKPVSLQVSMGDRPKPMVWSWSGGEKYPLGEEQQRALEESLEGLKDLDIRIPAMKDMGNVKIFGPGSHRYLLRWNKPLLGVEMVETTPELRETLGGSKEAGVLVGKVLSGSAAEKAGLRVGDLILSVDGTKVSDAGELGEAIREREGKTIDLDVVRDKKTMHIKATLPKFDEPEDEPTGPRAFRWTRPVRTMEHMTTAVRNLLNV